MQKGMTSYPFATERKFYMCIAVPAQLISIDKKNDTGIVTFSGNEMTVSIAPVSPQVGDYVLIHAGCAIEIVAKETAEEILDI